MKIVTGERELLHVVGALGPGARFSHLLHSWHEQGDQNRDDGDDHQQFNKRERCSTLTFDHRSTSRKTRINGEGWSYPAIRTHSTTVCKKKRIPRDIFSILPPKLWKQE